MADKARYYLEQSIPELKEFEKRKIFTKVSHQNCKCRALTKHSAGRDICHHKEAI